MRKFLILWFIILLVVKCSNEKSITIDPLINAYKVDNVKLDKSIIKDSLNHFLHKYNRKWSQENKQKCIDALYYGQQEFDIDYKIVMSLISIESQYRIVVTGKNIRRGKVKSIDYGLTQQNSKYIKQRYKSTEEYLNKYKIKYTNSNFDIGKNIFSCYMLLRDTNEYGSLIMFRDYIASYNVGIRGIRQEHTQKIADKYFNKFMKELLSI